MQAQQLRRLYYRLFLLYSQFLRYRSVSLSTAKLTSAERGIYLATYLYHVSCLTEVCCLGTPCDTRFLCVFHDRHFIRKALDNFQRKKEKNQYIGPLPHPLASLACSSAGSTDCTRSRLTTQLIAISYKFIICPICLKFSHKFLHIYIIQLHFKHNKA